MPEIKECETCEGTGEIAYIAYQEELCDQGEQRGYFCEKLPCPDCSFREAE